MSAVRDLHEVFDKMAALEQGAEPGPKFAGQAALAVRFRIIGEEVAIYVGHEQAGQTHA